MLQTAESSLWNSLYAAPDTKVRFELRHFDDVLASFDVWRDQFSRYHAVLVGKIHCPSDQLPLRLDGDCSGRSLLEWLSSRTIPKNQAFVEQVLKKAGIPDDDKFKIIQATLGLTLGDSYWFVPEGFDKAWDEVNLYTNGVDSVLGIIAYTGYTTSQREKAGAGMTWSLQVGGRFPKAWRRRDGKLYLYKAGSCFLGPGRRSPNEGREPWSEFLTAQLEDYLGIYHVPYWLDVWHEELASVCPIMTSPEVSLVPAEECAGAADVFTVAALCARLGEGYLGSFKDMLVLDALIVNCPDP